MCGIAGCVLKDGPHSAASFILQALRRLEYRGYDSVGMATLHAGKIKVLKDAGRVDVVNKKLRFDAMEGSVGLGHTRWATHGVPCMDNAHPFTDCSGKIALCHNGIIENFTEFKAWLEAEGHKFSSRTDTEVLVHMIEEEMKKGSKPVEAVADVLRQISGSYAIVVMFEDYPERLIVARRESPLVIGLGDDGTYCASDILAILPITNRMMTLEEGDIAELAPDRVVVRSVLTGQIVDREVQQVKMTLEVAEKGGYPHFMLKEIAEQPQAIHDVLKIPSQYIADTVSILAEAKKVLLVGCGTAYHAAMTGEYALAKLAGIQAKTVVASEFEDLFEKSTNGDTAVVLISQSGETIDTLAAAKSARSKGAKIVAITNTLGSSITRLADAYISQNSGPEIGVAATKTFTAQVTVLSRVAMELGRIRNTIAEGEYRAHERALLELPATIEAILATEEDKVKDIAKKYSRRSSACFLGRGASVATALEGRLKLLELTYIPAIAYPAGESKHGFISVVEKGYPVIFIAPGDETQPQLIGNIMEMKARGADIISICKQGNAQVRSLSDRYIEIPYNGPSTLSPVPYTVPLQLLAYYWAVAKKCDPDFPRNLAKSVTVR